MVEGFSLQDVIRFATRQRDLAAARGFSDVAAFWSDVLATARMQVAQTPHQSMQQTL